LTSTEECASQWILKVFYGDFDRGGSMPAGRGKASATDSPLTRRELDCLLLLAQGRRNAEIGKSLEISVPTVEMHLKNARLKLGARTRVHAVAIAVARGLVTLP
jgi:DNA-binding CsgD family transcriptional regulator